jgi:hypothetical protein
MSGFFGADTAQLRDYGDLLGTGTQRLSEIASRISSQAHSVEWIGSDADEFRSEVSGRVNGLFDSAAGLMDRFRHELGDHAEQQDEASGADDGGSLGAIGDFLGDVWDGAVGVHDVLTHQLLQGPLGILDGILDLANVGVLRDAAGAVTGLSTAMRVFNGIAGPLSILGGIDSLFFTDYDGLRGGVDRFFGAVSIASGLGGIAVAAGFALGPILGPALAIGGIAAGAWALGNLVYDNWDAISSTVSNAVDATGEFIGDAAEATGEFLGNAAEEAGEFLGGVAEGVGDFVGGLF